MNKDYDLLISKYYDLPSENKKKEIFEEFNKISKLLDAISNFNKEPYSNSVINYDFNNKDNEDENLVKIYNNLLIIEEKLILFLKDNGY